MLSSYTFFRCPLTRQPLTLTNKGKEKYLKTKDGSYSYPLSQNGPNLIPDELPENLKKSYGVWEKLQHNGSVSYDLAPSLNLSNDEQYTVELPKLMKLSGRVLDIGCGPQSYRPAYIKAESKIEYWGLDHLPGSDERGFKFFQGLGELLPLDDELFNSVLFANSLDHMIDYRQALREAFRVLKYGGSLNILMDKVDNSKKKLRLIHLLEKGTTQFVNAYKDMGLFGALKYIFKISRLTIPQGALDYFHVYFPEIKDIKMLCMDITLHWKPSH